MQEGKKPKDENPDALTGLKQDHPREAAAGLAAIISSFRHMLGSMGLGRAGKALLAVNQKDGFDCPSCAWPDPDDDRSGIAEYCENGAKAIAAEATTKKLDSTFFAKHTIYELSRLSDYEMGRLGRIAEPLYLPEGSNHYLPVSWEEAFEKIAEGLRGLESPDEAVFYTSGRTSNEAAFLYQLFVREFGTNNLPDCSNMCHESSGVALKTSIGVGKGTVKLDDFYQSELILIIGQNPGTNAPRMLTALQKAKRNGAVIVAINPMPETGFIAYNNPQTMKGILGMSTRLADHYFQIRVNQDQALLKAMQVLLWQAHQRGETNCIDDAFIREKTSGATEFLADLSNHLPYKLAEQCGLSTEKIETLSTLLKQKNRIITCWSMGLTQHPNAVTTIQEIANLHLMKGSIGKPGAGLCPVRGHSNVQGDRTMGIYAYPSAEFLDKLEQVFGFSPPRKPGYDVVRSIHAMQEEKVKIFFAMGGNFLSATPDTHLTAMAMRKCRLTVQVSTKLNRGHLVHGKEAIILPVLARSDRDLVNGEAQFVSCENSMGVIQSSKGVLTPVSSKLLSEPVLVCRLARAVLRDRSVIPWEKFAAHYDTIRQFIAQVIPGCEHYNERVRQPGGFYLPNPAREQVFETPSGKAFFNIHPVAPWDLPEDQLILITIRSHDQFNTTIYGLDDRYRGIHNERRVILMNKEDIKFRGLQNHDLVDITSHFRDQTRTAQKFVVAEYPIAARCAAAYFPEANVLVPIESVARKSNTPAYKSIRITVSKSNSSFF